jgi:uncharacterized protein YukE
MDMTLIDVDVDELRARAADLDRTARSLASGHGVGPPERAVGWATAAALTDLAAAVSSALGEVGARVASAGGLVRQAAAAYEAADTRSAQRLTRVG